MGFEIPETLPWVCKDVVRAGDRPEGDETASLPHSPNRLQTVKVCRPVDACLLALEEHEDQTAEPNAPRSPRRIAGSIYLFGSSGPGTSENVTTHNGKATDR